MRYHLIFFSSNNFLKKIKIEFVFWGYPVKMVWKIRWLPQGCAFRAPQGIMFNNCGCGDPAIAGKSVCSQFISWKEGCSHQCVRAFCQGFCSSDSVSATCSTWDQPSMLYGEAAAAKPCMGLVFTSGFLVFILGISDPTTLVVGKASPTDWFPVCLFLSFYQHFAFENAVMGTWFRTLQSSSFLYSWYTVTLNGWQVEVEVF